MTGFWGAAVPITAGVAALTVAAILWIICDRSLPRVTAILVLAGVTGIIGTAIGGWANNAVNGMNSWASSIIGRWTGASIAFVAGLVCLAIVVWDIWKGQVAAKTLAACALLPILVTTIPGPIGELGASATGAVAGGVGTAIGALFGA